jgi:hypothetical protein
VKTHSASGSSRAISRTMVVWLSQPPTSRTRRACVWEQPPPAEARPFAPSLRQG